MTAKNELGIERSCPMRWFSKGYACMGTPTLCPPIDYFLYSVLRTSFWFEGLWRREQHSPQSTSTCLGNVSIRSTLIRHLNPLTHVLISPNNIYKLFYFDEEIMVNFGILHDKLYIGWLLNWRGERRRLTHMGRPMPYDYSGECSTRCPTTCCVRQIQR